MSNNEKNKIPDAPALGLAPGNLLSSVAPPSQLPSLVTATTSSPVKLLPNVGPPPASQLPPGPGPVLVQPVVATVQPATLHQNLQPQSQSPDKFSPVIPLSKGEPMVSIRSPEDSQTTQSPESLPASTPESDKLGDIMPGSGLITWVKGAVSTGGILHRVAEKAKSSVDSMITTLDPQMKEYLNSGGDITIVVASDKDVKISPVREAFQAVFGKATISGYPAQSDVTASQPVGYAAAYAAAKQRIAHVRSTCSDVNNNVPVVAVESFLHEAVADRWYDLALLVLSQPSLGIELQMQSQGTAVPQAVITAAKEATPDEYEHVQTGFKQTVGEIMAASLQVPHTQWQEATTGVSRRELLVLAARALAGSYKRLLAVSAAET